MKDMTREEKKEWILKQWNVSSGDEITKMLQRYFTSVKKKNKNEAEKIFV